MSRQEILRALRRGEDPVRDPADLDSALPDPRGPWQRFADPQAQFAEAVAAAGGSSVSASDDDELLGRLRDIALAIGARRVHALDALGLPAPESWDSSLSTFGARELASTTTASALDLAVLAGRFGVAENGGVWVDSAGWPHPALHVLPEHLVLVVPRGELVDTMHDAYARLDLSGPGFGVLLAGPSKTADIEQALVIGAHGPRSLHVVWRGRSAASG